MNNNQLCELHQKINQGVEKAINKAIERHKKLGESIAIWEKDQVVVLSADQIPKISNNS